MNQLDLFGVTPENRTKYLVLFGKRKVYAWYFGDTFTLMNYQQTNDCEILERIGSDSELFN